MHLNKITSLILTILSVSFTGLSASQHRTSPNMIEPYVGDVRKPAEAPEMQYMPDGVSYASMTEDGKRIAVYDIASGKETSTLFDAGNTRENRIDKIEGFIINNNASRILVYFDEEPVYRRSKTAKYYVYEVRSRILTPLSTEHPRQQAPLFSPDGLMIAYTDPSDNNIYLKKLTYNTEVAVTTDGSIENIINGVPDWSYEEEFATTSSICWAPDNRMLCYIKYDISQIPFYSLPLYDDMCGNFPQYAIYPGSKRFRYPVAGKPNASVSVHAYDIDTRKTTQVSVPDRQTEYIPRIAFGHDAARLMVTTLNRAQNRMNLFCINPRSTVAKSVLVEEWKAWLNPVTYQDITWLDDSFVILSSRTGYDHLYRYSYTGSLLQTITSGAYDVTKYYGFNATQGAHYYQSTSTGSINRVVSRTDKKGTVNLTPAQGTASASFSAGNGYYTVTYSNATTPPVTTLYKSSASDKKLRTLVDNTTGEYASRYAPAPKREFLEIKSADGTPLNAYIIKPTGFNPSKKYPVVIYQYSGPGSQEVSNKWVIDWGTFFASNGYVVVCADGRGTGFRGRAFMDVVYKNLGHAETADQLAVARYVASLPFVDPTRIGIHGWSFGGYETLMAAGAEGSPYAAAVAVAPVSDWRYYDSIYTERYMLTPQENAAGYDSSSALATASDVNCPLLIMYGTADDNVHPENTIAYITAMQQSGNWCDLLYFANMNHSINKCGARNNLYARMFDYFNAHLK